MAVSEPDDHPSGSAGPEARLAPPVVAVVVTHEPGPWLEECLGALGAQDYPNLSVLVVDAGSAEDPLPRVAGVLPAAFVRRLEANPGFGPAANEVLKAVEGASFFAFCHDDVRLAPTAVRALVEEAYRSNAGVVGPKVVSWDAPATLLQVGLLVDKTGVVAPMVERGELDQEQHDRVRDVFVVPGGCTVIRADLFETLGGFDPGVTFYGEDLDLCWRAQVAGARVVVVPVARAEHLEAMDKRKMHERRGRLDSRHRLRTMLICYSWFHLLRVLPQAALASGVEVVEALATRHLARAGDVAGAWWWNLRHWRDLAARRSLVRASRRVPDRAVRRLQVRGSAHFTAFVRGEVGGVDGVRSSLADVGRSLSGRLDSRSRRLAVFVWALVAAVLLVGSRDLLGGHIPAVAGLAPLEDSPFSLLREYASGWRSAGLGSEGPAPTALALLGVGGLVLLGGMGLLQQILVLGALPVGILGAWRLSGPLASSRARAVAVLVYATVALPYDALGRGSWGGLILYAAAPWILDRMMRSTGEEPFERPEPARRWRPVVTFGLLVAMVAAFVPAVVLLVPILALALLAAGLLTGGLGGAGRALRLSLGASAVAAVLHIPWTIDFLIPGSEWSALSGVATSQARGLGVGVLQFQTDGGDVSVLGWAVLLAAALPLVVGSGWRLAWSVRAWFVAFACWGLVLADSRGLVPVDLPSADVILAPAAAALALSAALGMAAFERDLRGYRFGWRQAASLVAGLAVAVGIVPLVGASVGGRWDLPEVDFARTLAFMGDDEVTGAGAFRVLWVGSPDVLPVGSSRLDDDLAYGVSSGARPGAKARWSAPSGGSTQLLADALRLAGEGQTDRLGRLLAPMGVRYVVLAERAAPARGGTPLRPVPGGLRRTIAQQLDMRRIELDPALDLYENAAWAPLRAELAPETAERLRQAQTPDAAVGLDLSGSRPVLADRKGRTRFEGRVEAGLVYLGVPSSDRWQLRVDGERTERSEALGWANAFDVGAGGDATLSYRTSPLRWLAVALQVALWVAALRLVGLRRWAT